MPIRNPESGFSLLESLVALVVLAAVLGAALRVHQQGSRMASLVEDYTHATRVAESVLAVQAARQPLAPGESQGREPGGYVWRSTVRPLPAAPDPVGQAVGRAGPLLMEVVVEVTWDGLGGERSVRLATVRFGVST